MQIASATTSTTDSAFSTAKTSLGNISGDDFMKVLIKQLQMQDPLQPMTNQEMVQQMSTIRQLEMNTQLTDKLSTLTDQQRFGAAASLIGKQVKGVVKDENDNETVLEGVVTSVRFTDSGEAVLELDNGQALPLAKLQEVKNLDAPATTTSNTNSSANSSTAAAA